MFKKSFYSVYFALFLICIFSSCSSINKNHFVASIPDFSDSEIVNIEIQRIQELLEENPIKALWRASLLKNEDVYASCIKKVQEKMNSLIEEENFFEAEKYLLSLKSLDLQYDNHSERQIENALSKNLLQNENDKVPEKISDCIKATATIWVDRGVKIRNGSGYADIIIGSGFFIDKRGYLVTNYHVIDSMVNPSSEGYSRLYIKLYEDMDTKIPAKVVGYDKMLDLALVKAEIEPSVVLALGSSSELNVGDRVLAIGSPVGLEGTLTSGIISARDRKLLTLGDVFQVDAAINSGNSGGPLIDEKMNVQAIVFAGMLAYQGLNFAIPVEYLKQELTALYNEYEIIHPWLGGYGKTFRMGNSKKGLEVLYVMPGSAAHLSSLKEGDVIKAVNGKEIHTLEDFQLIMLSFQVGSIVSFDIDSFADDQVVNGEKNLQGEVLADGVIHKRLCIYLEERPEFPAKQVYYSDYISSAFYPLFGMRLVSVDEANRKTFVVSDVLKSSTAEELHFTNDDVITINSIQLDENDGLLYAQIYARRKKKGFLDVGMIMQTPLDSPYFF